MEYLILTIIIFSIGAVVGGLFALFNNAFNLLPNTKQRKILTFLSKYL